MQWINDNTAGLRQNMVDAGIPAFGAGYNSTFGTGFYVGDNPMYYPRYENRIAERQGNISNQLAGFSSMGWQPTGFEDIVFSQQFIEESPLSNQVATGGSSSYSFGRTNNAVSLAGFGWGINEHVWVNNGQWLGKNLKYNSITWGGNGATGARSIAIKSAKVSRVLGQYAFYVNAVYSLYGVGTGIYSQDYSKALGSGMSGIYSGIATYGNVPGMVIAGPLVIIDATIGLDCYMQNQIDIGIQRGNEISNGNYSMWTYPRFGQSAR